MYKKLIPIVILLLFLSGLSGCIDRDLCYYSTHPHTGLVEPRFNWKSDEWTSLEIPERNGMCFLFVGDGGAFRFDTLGVYRLLTGGYSILFYNTTHTALFRKASEISATEAYTEVLGGMTKEPGVIFRDVVSSEVFPDDTTVVDFYPKAAVKGVNLTVHVEGLDEPSHITKIHCFLKGCATAVNLSSGERNTQTATIPFSMKRVTPAQTAFTSRVTTFGPAKEKENLLELNLMLYTGGTVTFSVDLSPYWKTAEENGFDVVNCTLTVRIKKLGITTGDTEGDVSIDNWNPGTWDTLL